MTRHRVLIDVEFTVDEHQFKMVHLPEDPSGVSDVTEASVRDAVTDGLIATDWAEQGLAPVRSMVSTRHLNLSGTYDAEDVPPDGGVGAA
jgi:hypothetical protein